jgi:hypothetical protein
MQPRARTQTCNHTETHTQSVAHGRANKACSSVRQAALHSALGRVEPIVRRRERETFQRRLHETRAGADLVRGLCGLSAD